MKITTSSPMVKQLLIGLLALVLAAPMITSCGSNKKALAAAEAKKKADAAAAKQRKVDRAVSDLTALLNDETKTADQLQAALNEIKGRGANDPEVTRLIKLVEEKIATKRKTEAEAKAKADEERRKAEDAKNNANAGPTTVDGYFGAIANAPSTMEANKMIANAMKMFSSEEADVLIIISMVDGEPDYDEPTTIGKYLNYLKDQKKNLNKVYKTEKDAAGKIKLLELIKK